MVSLATDNPTTQQFVAEFNHSLARAKTDALAFLSSLIAGADTGDVPRTRERRLAASQILRTRFLHPDGSEASPKPRRESRLRDSDADRPHPHSEGRDAERSSEVREAHSRRATDSRRGNRCASSRTDSPVGSRPYGPRRADPMNRAPVVILPGPTPVQNLSAHSATLREIHPVPAGSRRMTDMGLEDVPARRDGTPDPIPARPGPVPMDPSVGPATAFTRRGGCEHDPALAALRAASRAPP